MKHKRSRREGGRGQKWTWDGGSTSCVVVSVGFALHQKIICESEICNYQLCTACCHGSLYVRCVGLRVIYVLKTEASLDDCENVEAETRH